MSATSAPKPGVGSSVSTDEKRVSVTDTGCGAKSGARCSNSLTDFERVARLEQDRDTPLVTSAV